jgi:hypothetical protein
MEGPPDLGGKSETAVLPQDEDLPDHQVVALIGDDALRREGALDGRGLGPGGPARGKRRTGGKDEQKWQGQAEHRRDARSAGLTMR